MSKKMMSQNFVEHRFQSFPTVFEIPLIEVTNALGRLTKADQKICEDCLLHIQKFSNAKICQI